MRICLVYDCLFPWTVGGLERWMRNLGEALAADGHDVTYLTRVQWAQDEPPEVPGVRVVAVSKDEPLYGPDGSRTIGEPLRFGWGVLKHLWRHGRDYDVVHTASFPYFSLLAAGVARRRGRYRIVAEWHEVWSPSYWAEYLGGVKGRVARAIQAACARVPQQAYCFSALHARRLREEGLRGTPTVLRGEWAGLLERPSPAPASGEVVFAGRLIPEKQAPAVVPAVVEAARRVAGLRGVIFGDGPQRAEVDAAIARAGATELVRAPGFVDGSEVEHALRHATCMLLPSTREGYGMVVVEAAAAGVPSVVVAAPDNAAVEHVEDGVNGFVAPSASPSDLADAIVRCHEGGEALRESTADWFAAHAEELSLQTSLRTVLAGYAAGA
ncbi:glycosyltransferase family 4 protein [Conexibacter sp. SYSU D00693]|uniref:glycosyltransferase family 4 protein n=1 Tax=Conexibacter sp. SYSU D00693 TaxID=2812560 RepID=UPI00196B9F67|nr:glycosyltransferase [Conexibacter sp. SYSU D00693]